MSARLRWTDERLDDLAALAHSTAERESAARRDIDRHSEEIKRLATTGDRRSERSWQVYIIGLGVIGTSIANIIVNLTAHH